MILITGANGQTGRAVIKALLVKGEKIRVFIHNEKQKAEILKLGTMEVVAGDMMDKVRVKEAVANCESVYHICSAFNPNEVEIGKIVINEAVEAGVEHFVYHSVLHSVLQDMAHHQKKLHVEEILINSGLNYTVIQPAVIMQNILESWGALVEKGIFRQLFFTTDKTKMCLVDLQDVAAAVAEVLTTPHYRNGTFELCGTETLSLKDITEILEQKFEKEITVETPPASVIKEMFTKIGKSDYFISSFLKMFHHYNIHGFAGNASVLTWILGRKPNTFATFVERTLHDTEVK